MSDFDKEAEREKLREKYEQDQKSRETTEKMSELLLQGATMTNSHCGECGDPIFRYDGQAFCPTCEKPVDSAQNGDDEADDQQTIRVAEPSDDARVKFGADASEADDESTSRREADATEDASSGDDQTAGRTRTPRESPTPDRDSDDRTVPSADPTRSRSERTTRERPDAPNRPRTDRSDATVSADLTDARASLTRTLARFAEQAEATDDPQRARESLAAAREAAETLAALRR